MVAGSNNGQRRRSVGRAALVRKPLFVLGLAVVTGTVGWVIGTRNNGASQLSGTGYAAPTEIAIQADGSWYEVPVDVPRVGSNGGRHFGSRPARIPLRGAIHHLRFGAVQMNAPGGSIQSAVAWVSC